MAAPHVAGLAALIKSIKPHLTAAEIMSVIRYSADDINSSRYPGKDDYVGYGRLNMEKALAPIMLSSSKKQ
jgi:subtilisin family serine protease